MMQAYITSMPLIYNEMFIAIYDRLKEIKNEGGKIYFASDEGVAAGKARIEEFDKLAEGYKIFDGVIGYSGGREKSAEAIMKFAKENNFDATHALFITNSDVEHQAMNQADIPCMNTQFYNRQNLLCDLDQLIPS
jgi:methionine salvage enolase-phosphatase E1